MPPQLDQTWASAYLQILIATLFFALGIPAVIQQLAHEDIRHVSRLRSLTTWWMQSLSLIGLACGMFIWFFHPMEGQPVSRLEQWLASLVVTAVPLGVTFFGFKFWRKFDRERVIEDLCATLKTRYRSTGKLEADTLNDLVYLGGRSKGGYEKQLVLKACAAVAETVQANQSYEGRELTPLITSLTEILDSPDRPGDGENYTTAARILRSIQAIHSKRNHIGRLMYSDSAAVRRTLSEIGVASIKSQRDLIVLKLLDIGGSCSSDMVFEMGVSALRGKRFLIANSALNKLQGEAEEKATTKSDGTMRPSEVTSKLLGLLSHFAASGDSGLRRARLFFERYSPDFLLDLEACLKAALEYHYGRTDFQTADRVAALANFLKESESPVAIAAP